MGRFSDFITRNARRKLQGANEATPTCPIVASTLKVIRPGTKEWDDAVGSIRTGGNSDFRVGSRMEAVALLTQARNGMREYPTYYESDVYRKGYEHHPSEVATVNAPHNDLRHIKWKDYESEKSGGGHIFYGNPRPCPNKK